MLFQRSFAITRIENSTGRPARSMGRTGQRLFAARRADTRKLGAKLFCELSNRF